MSEQFNGPPYSCSLQKQINQFLAYFNTSILISNLTHSVIGVRRTVRDNFNVLTGCRQNYYECQKYMKRFGTFVRCYEFWWSLAGLQARRQMCRGKWREIPRS